MRLCSKFKAYVSLSKASCWASHHSAKSTALRRPTRATGGCIDASSRESPRWKRTTVMRTNRLVPRVLCTQYEILYAAQLLLIYHTIIMKASLRTRVASLFVRRTKTTDGHAMMGCAPTRAQPYSQEVVGLAASVSSHLMLSADAK